MPKFNRRQFLGSTAAAAAFAAAPAIVQAAVVENVERSGTAPIRHSLRLA